MKITHVALKALDGPTEGSVISLPEPSRHHHIFGMLMDDELKVYYEQGFLLEDGEFVDREAAAKIAIESGQVERLIAPPNLFSEDLW